MLGALGNHPLVAHCEYLRGKVVAIYELGVAQHLGTHAKQFVDFIVVYFDLIGKFLRVGK